MKTRAFCPAGPQVSEIGLGTWQLGGAEWGNVTDAEAISTLSAAADEGITFLDTADIYGQGRSEALVGQFLQQRADRDRFFVATKLGRSSEPGWPENFTLPAMRRHTEGSLARLGVDALELTQTHCIPPEQMASGAVWDHLRRLKEEGLIKRFGASVESMDEALTCLRVEGLSSLQIIFNIFRQKPIATLFEQAKREGVALIARLPLASGLLAGKFSAKTTFAPADHRNFNRDGAAFNVGETFAGLPFELGVQLADQLKPLAPSKQTLAEFALRWCLDFDAITTVIPGAKRPEQARDNAKASKLPPLTAEMHERLATFYRENVAAHVRGKY